VAERLTNVKGLFTNTRTRVILLLTITFVVVAVVVGILSFRSRIAGPEGQAALQKTPGGIKSIPGAVSPTEQYARTVATENIRRAEKAKTKGGSAIPTIIRTTKLRPGEAGYELPADATAVGFTTLSRMAQTDPDLQAFELGLPTGSTLDALKKAGCGVEALKAARAKGVKARVLVEQVGCSLSDLRKAGYTAKELKDAGFSAAELRAAGFTAAELKAAGFTAAELLAAGFTIEELLAAGFTEEQLRAAGADMGTLPTGLTLEDLKKAGCGVEAVQRARAAGVSAATMKKVGCTAAQLRAGGYTAAELKAAGFSAKELKDAGFTAAELRAAGFTAAELKAAGFTAAELRAAGFSAAELLAAGFTADELRAAGFSEAELIAAGVLPPAEIPPAVQLPPAAIAAPTGGGDLEAILKRQAEQFSQQQREQILQQLQSSMANQAGQLFAAWQITDQQYVQGTAPLEDAAGRPGISPIPGAPGETPGLTAALIKAGSIQFAILETAVNSDEPGPVMAKIIQGPFKGATLLGVLSRQGKKVLLAFNIMSLPNYPSSMPISAVAIDPDTARTALATDVDSHYLLRYGTAFAASFMQGIGEAVGQSGSTIQPDTTGNLAKSFPKLTATEKSLIALGNVGQKFGSVLEPIFNTPPTVQVNSGVGLGILFLNDVAKPVS